jgi:hypothetical protein
MLKPGIYKYDVCCKNGKDHLYDSQRNVIFETTDLTKLFGFIRENSNGRESAGLFSYRIW